MDKLELLEYYGTPHWGSISLFQMVHDLGVAKVFPLCYAPGVHLDYARVEVAVKGGHIDADCLMLVANFQEVMQHPTTIKPKAFCIYQYDWNSPNPLLIFHQDEHWTITILEAWFKLKYVDEQRHRIDNLKANGNPFADLKDLEQPA